MPDTGRVAAYLAEVRERIAAVNSPAVEPIPVPGDDAGNARLRLWLEDAPRLLAVADEVLKLHREFRIYEECGHSHNEEDVDAGRATDTGDFISCHDGYSYAICAECCAGGGEAQSEECASDHSLPCWPCPTVQAVSRGLLGEEGT